MDYREREYFLINIGSDYLNDKLKLMKQIAPSLKLSTPERHFKNKMEWDYINIQNKWWNETTIHATSLTHLASVRNEHSYLFKRFLSNLTKAREIYYMKVDKQVLGQ